MQPSKAEQVLREALTLPEGDRVRLLEALLDSVDQGEEGLSEEEWAAEFERRAREIDEGRVSPVAWDDVRRELLEIVGSSRAR